MWIRFEIYSNVVYSSDLNQTPTIRNEMWNEIWNASQIWISFQNESVRLESDLKNSIMALPYLAIPSSICVEMLKFGTFCHFQKAHRVPDRFVSLNNPLKLKGLGALCKISLSTQDVRKWQILGMNVHYFMHPLVKISSMFSISILWCWGAKWYSEEHHNTRRMSSNSFSSHALWDWQNYTSKFRFQ